jgi:hypothetical protein
MAINSRLRRWYTSRWAHLRAHPDRGDESVNKVLWIAVTIVVVAAVGALFSDAITTFFNSLVFEIGFGSG